MKKVNDLNKVNDRQNTILAGVACLITLTIILTNLI
jgi:hypothetical protein